MSAQDPAPLESPELESASTRRPGTTRSLLSAHRSLLLVSLAFQLVLAFLLFRLVDVSRGSLAESGHWVSTKTTLARGLAGAQNFLRGRQGVAGQRLNLGAWYGFQEVIYRELLDPLEIGCRLVLHPRAHASVIFDKTEEGFAGVRLSLDPDRPSIVFRASPDGEFLERYPLDVPTLLPKTPIRLKVAFAAGQVTVILDGRRIGAFPMTLRGPHGVGFRGGERMAVVDEVAFRRRGAFGPLSPVATTYESFAPSASGRVAVACAAAVLLANAGALVWGMSRRPTRARQHLLGGLVANFTLAVVAAGGLAFLAFLAERYPAADEALLGSERAWRLSEADEIRAHIKEHYEGPPTPGTSRVLFLGSSQTWGAGAARESETMTAVLERLLNERAARGRRYECINGAISAAESPFLADLFEKEWRALRPQLVVVNLSNNDRDLPAFRRSLVRIAQLNRDAGTRTLFVLEANSGEVRPAALAETATKHGVMREVGAAEGVQVVDMHAHLLENQDRGFLFWDVVHLTSFGQRLVAERLYPEVARLLDEGRRPPEGNRPGGPAT